MEETNNMKELFEIINTNLDNCITFELKLNIINISNLISCRGDAKGVLKREYVH